MEAHGNESEVGRSQSFKRGAAEVDDAPLPNQALGGAAVRDNNHYRPVLMNNADSRAKGIEPAGGGQMIGIKGFSVGHCFAAQLFSVEAGDAGCGNLAGCPLLMKDAWIALWKVLFPCIGSDAARIALATDEEAGQQTQHCDSNSPCF